MTEKTITICGKEVKMLYCSAAEIAYERISNKSSAVFAARIETDDNGEKKVMPPEAGMGDYLQLAYGAIMAAYYNQEPPVSIEDLLLRATAEETSNLLTAIVGSRLQWYDVPKVVSDNLKKEESAAAEEEEEEGDQSKN